MKFLLMVADVERTMGYFPSISCRIRALAIKTFDSTAINVSISINALKDYPYEITENLQKLKEF